MLLLALRVLRVSPCANIGDTTTTPKGSSNAGRPRRSSGLISRPSMPTGRTPITLWGSMGHSRPKRRTSRSPWSASWRPSGPARTAARPAQRTLALDGTGRNAHRQCLPAAPDQDTFGPTRERGYAVQRSPVRRLEPRTARERARALRQAQIRGQARSRRCRAGAVGAAAGRAAQDLSGAVHGRSPVGSRPRDARFPARRAATGLGTPPGSRCRARASHRGAEVLPSFIKRSSRSITRTLPASGARQTRPCSRRKGHNLQPAFFDCPGQTARSRQKATPNRSRSMPIWQGLRSCDDHHGEVATCAAQARAPAPVLALVSWSASP
mmetsp:Transcript_17820/g.51047  ORF Transcript_17820/g.51047 Transcript_17820/m.51047 type:complete len:324 (+) Transcript_17820:108-1079(+)